MEIVQKFGLEAKLFLFQLINFLFVVFILKKFLFAPLKRMLDERRHKIEQSLQDAESTKTALENASKEKIKILAAAKANADKLTKSAKISIDEEKLKATAQARLRSEQILENAKRQVAVEFSNMSKQIGKTSIDISSKVLSKVLSDLFTDDEKQKLMSRALEKINEQIAN
ncbi:MAG: ATP synthase F0 subunit B [Endomicrobium sp.]|jgi:F-type H+-transporting ATPase subunit b|nr:ATP synthase F0 subunit B [Endomicrobium sp.]